MLVASAGLFVGFASLASAHEVVLLPVGHSAPGKRAFLPLVKGGPHLAAAIDFGTVPMGAPVTQTFDLANTTPRLVTVEITAPSGLTVAPAQLTLQPAGSPGSSAPLEVTLTPTAVGPYAAELTAAVTHEGVARPGLETLPVSATVGSPPRLEVSVPEWDLFDVDEVDVGLLAQLPYYDYNDVPSFAVTIKNVGDYVARNVTVLRPIGFGSDYPDTYGACQEAEMSICINPSGLVGDLQPGEEVVATVRILPESSVEFSKTFEVRADLAPTLHFDVNGEIVPFALPNGLKFLRPGDPLLRAAADEGYGEGTDPLGNDELGQLRVTSFDARTVFSVGEVDTVDLRAGNLTLVVPIGDAIPVRGPLSYSLQAVYNSDLWYRKTMGTYRVEVNGRWKVKPLDGEWVNPLFNLRGGWSFHLGRLLPPRPYGGTDFQTLCQAGDPFNFEDEVDTGERFVYVEPNGTQHEFWRHLHGAELSNPEEVKPQAELEDLYTRDGSHLRLHKESETVRWVEEPSGIRRRFVKQAEDPASREPTLPDLWLLDRIEDRYGNRAKITYTTHDGEPAWEIGDGEGTGGADWRQVIVTFKTWAGREADEPLIVDQVLLPGFGGGAARSYTFNYGSVTLDRARGGFYSSAKNVCPALDTTIQLPRLDSITLPDGTAWSFTYTTSWVGTQDDLRLTSVGLPTGASIDYEYQKVWDANPRCSGNNRGKIHPGVSQRKVTDVDGSTVLERTRYLRQYRRDDIPQGICEVHNPSNQGMNRPLSEQVVAVWTDQQSDLSTFTKHYFNIWPYDDRCKEGLPGCVDINAGTSSAPDWRLASRRTFLERNAMIDPSHKDAEGLALSTETYSCPWSIDNGPAVDFFLRSEDNTFEGDDLDDVITYDTGMPGADCTKMESNRKKIEVERAGVCTDGHPSCLRAWRVTSEKTVYHDDRDDNTASDRWSRVDRSKYDGLGHYRKSVIDTSWGAPRTEFRNYNPDAGTLVLFADHRVKTNIEIPDTWILETYTDHWAMEGSVYRGGEAHFDPDKGHLKYDRTWRCPESDHLCSQAETDLTEVRTGSDLVVRHIVNGQGELTRERFYGADTFNAVPTDGAWWDDGKWGGADNSPGEATWASTRQDYRIAHEYSYGVPSKRYVVGDSVHEMERTIDQKTGWPKTETLNSGEVLTYTYDPMGRVQGSTSSVTANRQFQYTAPSAGAGWKLTTRVYAADEENTLIREVEARYDGLGRLSGETLPTWNGTATRSVSYHPSGKVRRVSSLDAASKAWTFDYDYAGRRTRETQPDNRKRAWNYAGARVVREVSCVETGSGVEGGICNGTGFEKAEARIERDGHDRVALTRSADGIETTFTYDPAGMRTSALRKDVVGGTEVEQTRSWSYDGLGFQLSESIPERSVDASFSNFTTRGLARTLTEGSREQTLAYDRMGRLRSLSVKMGSNPSEPIKDFVYCDPAADSAAACSTGGPENGQLIEATRYNQRTAGTSGTGQDGAWEVQSSFGYDSAGRRSSRHTKVRWAPKEATPSNWTEFTQGWGYDDLGNVTSRSYPRCSDSTWECGDDTLLVTTTYRKGFYLHRVDVSGAPSLDADLTYHDSGLVHQVIHAGGGGTDTYGLELDADDNAIGMPRIGSIELATGTASALDLGTLSYDGAGNITAIGSDAFLYDLDSRLTQADLTGHPTSFQYDYDAFDNIVQGGGTIDRNNNQLKGPGYSYDTFGNLKSARVQVSSQSYDVALRYDELDSLIYLYNDPSSPGVAQLSIYDHDDLRILQQPIPGVAAETKWTLRDGLQVVRELVGRGPAIRTAKDFVYAGSRLVSSREYGASGYPTGNVRHYHEDQVGSVRLVTGFGANQARYAPYGQALDPTGEPAVGFQGHETDGLTTYMRGRTYLPGGGRFLQVDPARDASAWSLYAFASGNPINRVDPDGRDDDQMMKRDWVGARRPGGTYGAAGYARYKGGEMINRGYSITLALLRLDALVVGGAMASEAGLLTASLKEALRGAGLGASGAAAVEIRDAGNGEEKSAGKIARNITVGAAAGALSAGLKVHEILAPIAGAVASVLTENEQGNDPELEKAAEEARRQKELEDRVREIVLEQLRKAASPE